MTPGMTINHQEFRWQELFSNSKGKTSLALLCSGLACLTGCLSFIICVTAKWDAGLLPSSGLVLGALGYLTARRFTNDKELSTNETTVKDAQV